MSWNYRIIRHPPSKYKVGDKEFDREEYLAIHEVYYDDEDNPNSMTVSEIVTGDEGEDSLASLKWILEHQLESLDKPILTDELSNNQYKELNLKKQNEFRASTKNKKILKEKQPPKKGITKMKFLLKIFNPFLWFMNILNYFSHLEIYRNHPDKYDPYDFSKDYKYF